METKGHPRLLEWNVFATLLRSSFASNSFNLIKSFIISEIDPLL